MSIADEFPLAETDDPHISAGDSSHNITETGDVPDHKGTFWAQVRAIGIEEHVLRLSTHLLALVLIIAVLWGMRAFFLQANTGNQPDLSQRAALAAPAEVIQAQAAAQDTPVQPNQPRLPEWPGTSTSYAGGIPRLALLNTTIPSRPRMDVTTYTVQDGDTVFGIAERFGLSPETIFWGNREILNDNPHQLRAGQVLNILPTNGTYHKWSTGESLHRVAEFYGVDPLVIIEWPGNKLDAYTFNVDQPEIEAGTYLIVPSGKRAFIDWGPPRIYRDNPAVARTYGPGHCGTIVDGAVGGGTFVWPTTANYLSGYDYNPAANHPGIDIAGRIGNPIYTVDAGVVVYAGWSNSGYGYLIVLDHGNGWQSMYAHLSAIAVTCGQSVFQGGNIGSLGSSGNSTGPHLHFELLYGSARVNPWNYMSP